MMLLHGFLSIIDAQQIYMWHRLVKAYGHNVYYLVFSFFITKYINQRAGIRNRKYKWLL